MKEFTGKLAVITGGGTGMGRALARQLVAEGCNVATCDIFDANLAETLALCEREAAQGVRISTHHCDVGSEEQILAFRDEVVSRHETDHINLLFNNAGIAGGGSFVLSDRDEWERTFDICWFGVYHCTRAFFPLLMASSEGHIINTSSVNGFWAHLGPETPHTAYSSAKFAVKGFSEALLTDLRLNAPHIKVSVVMPGHVGTHIGINTSKLFGHPTANEMSDAEVDSIRARLNRRGIDTDGLDNDGIRARIAQQRTDWVEKAPVSPAQAAGIILDGVRNEEWRILVGDDAVNLDERARKDPKGLYDPR
ncbi:MAG: SDR family oxidoreductase [Proteobacteria bacterium]|jgi:NAD(P)-dependent dehydrogenase (short-subunit alcohol dehydrogenase family)|nr:SDR family oxidoreductase [Pseudomonadota bacterium]MDA1300213.1 SDR family oxidoreductase [Pseudomonadota bacterium]